MVNQVYNEAQIQEALAQMPGWNRNAKGEIEKQFQFEDFGQALAFVNKVGALAEEMQHHPDIIIKYNRVWLSLITHDAHGLTVSDFKLAAHTEGLFGQNDRDGRN